MAKPKGKNVFGGGNVNSLYVPMSELEQEAISRLVEAGDLRVIIVGWGVVNKPRVTFGDARLAVAFRVEFDRPEVPIAVPYLDLELRTGSGLLLYKDNLPTHYGGNPIQVAAGVFFDMIWDIQIQHIDPKLVKDLVPYATGLTSRLQDKDTGNITVEGNMKLDSKTKRLLHGLRNAEARIRKGDGKKH
jgi:hypothetical protein